MIKIYTISSCTSCKKAKTWLNNHQLPYKEQNLGKEQVGYKEDDIRAFLPRSIRNVENSQARMRAAL